MKNKISFIGAIILIHLFFSCKRNSNNSSNTANNEVFYDHLNIAETDYFGEYSLIDKQFGTETTVTIKDNKRVIKTNALPNHDVGEFPNPGNPNTIKAQNITYQIPLNPVYKGHAKWCREAGVALNGVKFEPETNERFVCENGEVFRVEAKQQLINLGLDFNNAHVQPTGAYHYHASPTSIIKTLDKGEDLVHIGFAKDGFPMYYSKSRKYKPSFKLINKEREGTNCEYRNPKESMEKNLEGTKPDGTFVQDWEYVEGLGDLDSCNGIKLAGKYMYIITDEYPYIGRCLNGDFTEKGPKGPPPPKI